MLPMDGFTVSVKMIVRFYRSHIVLQLISVPATQALLNLCLSQQKRGLKVSWTLQKEFRPSISRTLPQLPLTQLAAVPTIG